MSIKTRVRQLEQGFGDAGADMDNCPVCAVGIPTGDGRFLSGGKIYTDEDIDRCFPRGRAPFVVLDDGPSKS
mgnify:CR=1 FL=1